MNPSTGETIGDPYPVSSRADVDAALSAAAEAAEELLDADGEDLAVRISKAGGSATFFLVR